MLYLTKTKCFSHAIRCVDVVEKNDDELVLAGSWIPDTIKTKRYRFYTRYVDFTTLASIEGLKRIDQNEDLEDVVVIHYSVKGNQLWK